MLKYRRKILAIIIKYLFIVAGCLLCDDILDKYELLKLLDIDIISMIVLKDVVNILIGIAIILGIIYFLKREISEIHILLKENEYILKIFLALLEIVLIHKSFSDKEILSVFIMEIGAIYIILELECSKLFKYKFSTKSSISSYTEKPVVGRTYLSKNQIKALDQLIKLLDARTSMDSFNIGLIGEWGSGKTSITETMIYELQRRKRKQAQYFILKIDVHTLRNSRSVIEYVKDFFTDIFKAYGIGEFSSRNNVAFWSTIAGMIDDVGSPITISNFFERTADGIFCDTENERMLFVKKIQRLLKISKRKNIIFIIDDVDRSEIEEQVIKILMEFASINGIVSIVSLKKQYDTNLKLWNREEVVDSEEKKVDMKKESEYLNKYIHFRIRIEEAPHIEYEKSITEYIIEEFEGTDRNKICYLLAKERKERLSIFSELERINSEEVKTKGYIESGQCNVLTELFMYNLENLNLTFGQYFETLVLEYLYHSKELWGHVSRMLSTDPKLWEENLHTFSFNWTNIYRNEEYDWIQQLKDNAYMILWTLSELIEAINWIQEEKIKIPNDIEDYTDLYEYWMIQKYRLGEYESWEERKKRKIIYGKTIYGEIQRIHDVVINNADADMLAKLIQSRKFREIRNYFVMKFKVVANYVKAIYSLVDFVYYIRRIMNNYRSFKMQIREAEFLNLNYLDYLIKDWTMTEATKVVLENIKERWLEIQDENMELINVSVDVFIDNILYANYITRFGTRYVNGELKDAKIFLYHGVKCNILVISKEEVEDYNFIYLNVNGFDIQNVNEKEKEEIKKLADKIWQKEK